MRLFGVDPVSVEQELANQARLSEGALQRLRFDLEAARRVTADLVGHRTLLAAEVARLEAEQRTVLSQLGQTLSRRAAEQRSAEEAFAKEAAVYEARVQELTERLRSCHELEENLLRSLADLVGPFVATSSEEEASHA